MTRFTVADVMTPDAVSVGADTTYRDRSATSRWWRPPSPGRRCGHTTAREHVWSVPTDAMLAAQECGQQHQRGDGLDPADDLL